MDAYPIGPPITAKMRTCGQFLSYLLSRSVVSNPSESPLGVIPCRELLPGAARLT